MAKIKGTTTSGFKFSVDAEVFKDFRFLRAIRRANSNNGEDAFEASLDMVAILFNNKDEEERFYEFLAEKNGGRVPVEVVGTEVGEIMKVLQEKSKEAKN